jgi:hypothetical protein
MFYRLFKYSKSYLLNIEWIKIFSNLLKTEWLSNFDITKQDFAIMFVYKRHRLHVYTLNLEIIKITFSTNIWRSLFSVFFNLNTRIINLIYELRQKNFGIVKYSLKKNKIWNINWKDKIRLFIIKITKNKLENNLEKTRSKKKFL